MFINRSPMLDINAISSTGLVAGIPARSAGVEPVEGTNSYNESDTWNRIWFLQKIVAGGLYTTLNVYSWNDLPETTAATLEHTFSGFDSIRAYDMELDTSYDSHIVIVDDDNSTGGIKYRKFSQAGAEIEETIDSARPGTSETRVSITLDKAGIPHVCWAGIAASPGDDRVWYTNRIGGTWATPVAVSATEATGSGIALRAAGDLLGLFINDGDDVLLFTRGFAAADSWSTETNLTALIAEDGSGITNLQNRSVASTYWNVAASKSAWHLVGYDFADKTNTMVYAEIPAKTTIQVEHVDRSAITVNDYASWDELTTLTHPGVSASINVSNDGESVSIYHVFDNGNDIYQRIRNTRVEGFETGRAFQVYKSIDLDVLNVSCGSPIYEDRSYLIINNGHLAIELLTTNLQKPPVAGETYDVTLDDRGYMLAGPMNKVDITASIPRISIATEQKRQSDFSELDTFGQSTFHQGRGEKYLQNPEAFSDSDNVLTHIPNQLTLALEATQSFKTGGVDADFAGSVVKFITYNSNFHALVAGTVVANNTLYTWDNTNSEWDAVTMDAAAAAIIGAAGAAPKDMAVYGGDLWIALSEAVNMVYFDLTANAWKDGQYPARCLSLWDGKLWRADNLNEIHWSTDPDAATPTWTLAGIAGDTDSFVNRLIVFQDALFVLKEDSIWAIERAGVASTYTIRLISDENVYRDVEGSGSDNGIGAFVHSGLLYWNRREQVVRFDGQNITAVGPERGADTLGGSFIGLPSDEVGEFRDFTTDGSFIYGAIAPEHNSAAVVPQVMVYNNVGWHSFWKGTTVTNDIRALYFVPIRTSTGVLQFPTLWFGDGTSIRYIKLPRNSFNPLDDASLEYVTSGTIDLAIYDANLPNVDKVFGELEIDQLQKSGFSGSIGTAIKLDEIDSSTISGHTAAEGTFWEIRTPTAYNHSKIRFALGEAPDTTAKLVFGGIIGGAPAAKKIQLRIKLTGSGGAANTPIVRGYALRFITKPKERFGWSVPIKAYTTQSTLDNRQEERTAAEIRRSLYAARTSTSPVPFNDGESESAILSNLITDPLFRVDGFSAEIGTVAINTFCSLHRKIGERSQYISSTTAAESGVVTATLSSSMDSFANIYASVWVLNTGSSPVHVQLRDGTTVIKQTIIYANPEWQLAEIVWDQVRGGSTNWSTIKLAVVKPVSTFPSAFHISGAMLTVGSAVPGNFIAGDEPRCYWVGTPNASRSARRSGYRVYVTGINEVYRFRRTDTNTPLYDSEIVVQLREVI